MPDRVRGHQRKTADGKTTTVRQHGRASRPRRALISPGHAWKLLKKAYRHGRRRRRFLAISFTVLAGAELGAWLTLEGFSFTLATAGVLATATGVFLAGLGGVRA